MSTQATYRPIRTAANTTDLVLAAMRMPAMRRKPSAKDVCHMVSAVRGGVSFNVITKEMARMAAVGILKERNGKYRIA